MGDKETKLSIIVDAQDKTGAGLNGVKSNLDQTKVSLDGITDAMNTVGKVGTVIFAGLSAATTKFVSDGLESESIAESFNRMTANVGIDADQLISKLNEVSANTVSTTDLMLSSNKAMALGVGNDIETVTELMEIARLKGRALGLDTTQAFNDIVTGIGRGSPLILDNLGIIIKLGEAQETYAQELGKTTQELTAAEQKQALLNAVLTAGRAELEAAGEITLTTKERMEQLKASFSNASSALGEALLPLLTSLVDKIVPVIEKITLWVEENPKLAETVLTVSLVIAGLMAVMLPLSLILPGMITAISGISAAMSFLATGPGVTMILFAGALTLAISQVSGIVKLLKNDWDATWLGMQLTFAGVVNGIITGIESMVNWIIDGINVVIRAINSLLDKLAGIPKIGDVFEGLKIDELQAVSLNKIDTGAIVDNFVSSQQPIVENTVNINGGTYLDEGVAQDIGDQIIDVLQLSTST